MYPWEPLSAAAFMNSPSSCLRVSAVALGDADTAGREIGSTIAATTKMITKTSNPDFIGTSETRAHSTPERRWCDSLRVLRVSGESNLLVIFARRARNAELIRFRSVRSCEDILLALRAHANFDPSQSLQGISLSRFPPDVDWRLRLKHRHLDADCGAGMAYLPAQPFPISARA